MTDPQRGVRLPLSPARKMVIEWLYHARPVPSLPTLRQLNVSAVADARTALVSPPSWIAIFMRAFGLVAELHPELRRALIPFPYRHLYQHPVSLCALLVEREWQGEMVVLGARIRAPERMTLSDLQVELRRLKETPVLDINYFRQVLRVGRLPSLLRRFTFWQSLYLSGYKRAKRLGTFMMSSLGDLGAEQCHPLTPLTTYFTFGPIGKDGRVTAKIIYDHRVMDDRCVARCLGSLERVLLTTILGELQALRRGAA
jgi:hypothetical protein